MQDIIIGIINQYGYVGISFLIAIENIFPPIPSEVILTFGGFMTTISNMKVWGVVLSATIGSVLGAVVLYSLGRWLNPQRLYQWLDGKLGRILHLKSEDVTRAERWFSKHGKLTVFFCRFIPIVRSLISIPAGIAKMNMVVFLVLTALGTALWNIALVYLGVMFGDSWETAANYINKYSSIAAILFAAIIIVFCTIFYIRRIKHQTKLSNAEQHVDKKDD